jgi:putative ubiquitin-RnfH superfamily antitoxin RatB of RatAB toxin-antitoxin module
MPEGGAIRVAVWYSPGPRVVREWMLALPGGATVRDALESAGLVAPGQSLGRAEMALGIWGRKAALGQPLRDGDRVEIYRPLKTDPKVARRERFSKQGVRAAGLFARKKIEP